MSLGLFLPPRYPLDPEQDRVSRSLNTVILATLIGSLVLFLFTFSLFFSSVRLSLGILFCFIPGNLVAWFLLRRRRLGAASLVYLTNTYLIYVFQTVLNGGIESKALIVWSSLPVLSALLVSRRVSWVFAWVSFATLSFFAFLGWWGHPLEKWMPGIPTGLWVTNGFLIWFLFLCVWFCVKGWEKALALERETWKVRRRTEAERDGLRERVFQTRKMDSLGRIAGDMGQGLEALLRDVDDKLRGIEKRHPNDGELRASLGRLEETLGSARELNRSLQEFSRRGELKLERLELDPFLRELFPVLREMAGRGVVCSLHLGAMGGFFRGDRTRMHRIFQNLVVNAREAMEKGGKVSIRSGFRGGASPVSKAAGGNYLEIRVRDEGRGMDAETLRKIFEPFFSTKEKGTGLGLATVFGIVRQHEGLIEVDSQVGKGTEFKIYLPMV
jgi:signal transduction histidine kinase